MRYIPVVLVAAIFVSNTCCEGAAFKNKLVAFSAGPGIMKGHTTYRIGGHFKTPEGSGETIFPYSELEFPLDVWYGSFGAKIELNEKIIIEGKVKKGDSKNARKMKDSDWGVWYNEINDWPYPDSLDVYSESTAEADALTVDLSAKYFFNPRPYKKATFSFFIGGKYTFQEFEFVTSDLVQWYPSMNIFGSTEGSKHVAGKVLEYEVTQEILSLITGAQIVSASDFGLDLMVGYSPFAKAKDEDRHLLRSLVSHAQCKGDAFLLSVSGYRKISARCSLDLSYDYLTIDTDGKEKQYLEGQYAVTIEQKNFCDLHTLELTLDILF